MRVKEGTNSIVMLRMPIWARYLNASMVSCQAAYHPPSQGSTPTHDNERHRHTLNNLGQEELRPSYHFGLFDLAKLATLSTPYVLYIFQANELSGHLMMMIFSLLVAIVFLIINHQIKKRKEEALKAHTSAHTLGPQIRPLAIDQEMLHLSNIGTNH